VSRYPWQATAGGLILVVRVTPKGGRDEIGGIEELGDRNVVLKARVRAAPDADAANAALIKLLAHAIGIAPSRLSLVSGAAGRIKRVRIAGEPAALIAALMRAAKRG
jgi:uncharacterized protein